MELSKLESDFDLELMDQADQILEKANSFNWLNDRLILLANLADSEATRFYIGNLLESFMIDQPMR